MFLKPFRVKTQTSVKGSDRKKLRADIVKQFPNLSEDDILQLIPNKEEMNMTKISTHGGEIVQVYCVGKNPVFYELFKRLYPTVYALWQFPEILPVFRTWPAVFAKLHNGADLMLPGVIPFNKAGPKMFGNLQKGDLVSITIAGNKSPVGLGHALMCGEDMYMSALRGRGIGVLHLLEDALWEFGDKSVPPVIHELLPADASEEEENNEEHNVPEGQGLSADTRKEENVEDDCQKDEADFSADVEKLQVTDEAGAGADGTLSLEYDQDPEESSEEENEEKDPTTKMDELLHFCFTCAIKSKIKKSDLPLLTGNLMRDYMQPFSPGEQLDVKKSSYKKLSKFLQQKITEGYIQIKEQSKGVDAIIEIDKSHLGLRDLMVPDIAEDPESTAKADQGDEETFSPLTFTDVYCINAATADLFKAANLSKGDALIMSDVRQHITTYIKDNSLNQEDKKGIVTLDPVLAHIILKPSEGDLDHMPWEQVINRVVGKMQSGIAISNSQGLVNIRKGKMDPIKLDVVMRASQKRVTVVDNLEDYGINVKNCARLVQKAVASSCTVAPSEQKNKGPQLLVQGNQIGFVGNMLIEKYKIPKRYITGLQNAPKQKKKR